MKTSIAVVAATVMLAVAAAQNASASSGNAFDTYLNHHPALAHKMCGFYNTLLNQGWDDNRIYGVLSDAGAFRGFYGQGRASFNAIVRYCFSH
jgi:hypothetical protein